MCQQPLVNVVNIFTICYYWSNYPISLLLSLEKSLSVIAVSVTIAPIFFTQLFQNVHEQMFPNVPNVFL